MKARERGLHNAIAHIKRQRDQALTFIDEYLTQVEDALDKHAAETGNAFFSVLKETMKERRTER